MDQEQGFTPDEIREAAARDALHPDGIESFTPNEIRMHLNVPDTVKGNPNFDPLRRLQAIFETEIDPLPDGPEKEELMTMYDERVSERIARDIINLPEKDDVPNPHYQPAARLGAIAMQVREFPFARAETMERMYDLIDQKTKQLGLEKLYGPNSEEL